MQATAECEIVALTADYLRVISQILPLLQFQLMQAAIFFLTVHAIYAMFIAGAQTIMNMVCAQVKFF